MNHHSGRSSFVLVGLLLASGLASFGCARQAPYVWARELAPAAGQSQPTIGVRDTILVEVKDQPTLSGEFTVREDGHYGQPQVGSVFVRGLTPAQTASLLKARLTGVVIDPQIGVWLVKIAPVKVNVVGEVKTPGTYELTRDRTVVGALAAAGWVSAFAQEDGLYVLREGRRVRFRLAELTAPDEFVGAFRLNDGDVLVVE